MQDKKNQRDICNRIMRILKSPALMLSVIIVLFVMPAYSASKTMVVLGDSLSAEYGLPRGKGWVSLMQTRLNEQKINLSVVNASISGETTAGGKTRLPALLQLHRPGIVVIELGGNDGLRGLSLVATQANLHEMIKLANASGALVVLVGMQIPPNYGLDYSKRFNAMFNKLSNGKEVRLVPFLLEGLDDTEKFFQPDRIHPNQSAQMQMLDNVWNTLKHLIK
jgi:acyl-CoA thioesterase-1